MQFIFDRVEKLWEKEKMLVTSIFSFLPQYFQEKKSIQGLLNLRIVWYKIKCH